MFALEHIHNDEFADKNRKFSLYAKSENLNNQDLAGGGQGVNKQCKGDFELHGTAASKSHKRVTCSIRLRASGSLGGQEISSSSSTTGLRIDFRTSVADSIFSCMHKNQKIEFHQKKLDKYQNG